MDVETTNYKPVSIHLCATEPAGASRRSWALCAIPKQPVDATHDYTGKAGRARVVTIVKTSDGIRHQSAKPHVSKRMRTCV